jgi:hypothetical protein
MKKRSSFVFLFVTLGAAALFTNCTVKSVEGDGKAGSSSNTTNNTETNCTPGDSKDCTCTNGKKGAQECKDSGSGYAACVCDGMIDTGGTGNTGDGGDGNVSTGGTTGNGGSSYAGNSAYAGESPAADGGAGGAAPVEIDPVDCDACLSKLCAAEYDACDKDAVCPDQYGRILACITAERGDGLVKRDVVRGCGVTIGTPTSSSANGAVWPPDEPEPMAQATTDLINCLASGDGNDVSWANDDANFTPTIVPWKDGTCAKLACTSEIPPQ